MNDTFELPDSQCKRLTRTEMSSLRMLLVLASEMNYAVEDLENLLKIVPEGQDRMNELASKTSNLFRDLLGAVTDKQRRALRNSANDYDFKLTPKLSTDGLTLAMSREDMSMLVNCAREKCKYCTFAGKEIKSCKLYSLLETYIPLDEYGDDSIACPYAFQEWGN